MPSYYSDAILVLQQRLRSGKHKDPMPQLQVTQYSDNVWACSQNAHDVVTLYCTIILIPTIMRFSSLKITDTVVNFESDERCCMQRTQGARGANHS